MKKLIVIIVIGLLGTYQAAYSQSTYADSLLQIISLNKHDETERKSMSFLAIHYFKSDPAKAKMYMYQVARLATEADDYLRQSSAYALLSVIFQDEGKIDSAEYCISMLKTVAIKAEGDVKTQGNCNQAIGLYYKKKGDSKSALPYALAAIRFAEKDQGNKPYLGGQWLNAGDVYQGLGDYKNAMDCNLRALALFEQSGSKRGEAFCYTNMSALYILLKQYGNALNAAEHSLQLKTFLKDNRGTCTATEAIGQAYMGMKKFPQALSNYESALKIAIAEKLPLEEATCYFNMAKIFAGQDKDSLAIIYFKKSRAIAAELNNKLVVADTDMELSALYKSADSLKNTEANLVTSLVTFKETGNIEKEAENYQRLSEFYEGNKQFDKALEYSNRYHNIKDSISGIDIQVQLKQMEEQYKSVKKENEITVLKKDKELQQQRISRQQLMFGAAAALLILSLLGIILLVNRNRMRQRMKELELRNQIAADLHDEVGSSLSSIHMLSQMANQQGSENTHKDILARMSNNAKETMDKMGDIVWMIKPGETESGSLKQRIERFTYEMCSNKNIEATLELDEIDKLKLSMEQRKNIYLIFKEALNNAAKYSGAGKIQVTARVQNKEMLLQVRDFGKGFNSSIIKKGNGLDNMQYRAKELGGSLVISSIEGEGTTAELNVPV